MRSLREFLLHTDKAQHVMIDSLLQLVYAILVFLAGWGLIKVLHKIAGRYTEKIHMDPTVKPFLLGLLNLLMKVALIISVLGILGVQTTSFIAILGAAGLAVGLALKDNLSNFASGIFLLIFKPFRVGDSVTTNDGSGNVDRISLFQTILITPDQKVIYIPNSRLANGNITNLSQKPTRRNDLKFTIGYNDSIDDARRVFVKLLEEDERVLQIPKSRIIVTALLDSSVEITLRYWTKKEDYWDVIYDLTEKGKKALDQNGISIPFPQRDIHMIDQSK